MRDRDSLLFMIETLLPIADAGERRSIEHVLKGADLRQLRSFLEQFWDGAVSEKIQPWPGDSTALKWGIADEEYGSCPNREGHETDMGWILLRYGRPNTIVSAPQRHQLLPLRDFGTTTRQDNSTTDASCFTPLKWWANALNCCTVTTLRNCAMRTGWTYSRRGSWGHSVVDSRMNQMNNRDSYSREEPEDLFFNPR